MKLTFILSGLIFVLFSGTGFAFENILVITVDTLRADYLGAYGGTKTKTPNIDNLGRNGIVFKNVVAPAPFTLPSHVSLFTGMIPPVHGVQDNGGFYLNSGITTLAEIYKSKGYQTAAFVGAFPLDSRFGLNQGFDVYDDSYPATSRATEIAMPERRAQEVVDSALQWMKTKVTTKWFVWIHLFDPHFPYDPPAPFSSTHAKTPYAGEVAYVDQQIGRLTQHLKQNNLQQKTLVVFTADHGESLGEHKENTHGIFAYESTLRIPLILSPAPAPKAIDQRVRLIDVAPTVLAMQNQSFPSRVQGASLLNLVQKGAQPPQESYFEAMSLHLNAQWAPLRGFYSGNNKFIDLPVPELYDLGKDPEESQNLCAQDKQLCGLWKAKFDKFERPFHRSAPARAEIDSETAEKLRALGYVAGGTTTARKDYGPKDDPKNLIAYHNRVHRALTFYNQGYDLKALEILEQIIAERPDYSVAYLHASDIQARLGFPDKAVDLLKQAIQYGVSGENIQGKIGAYLFEAGKPGDAVPVLQAAIKQDPKELDNYNYLGMTFAAMGKNAEAEQMFEKGLSIDPSDAQTLNNLGTLYLKQKKYDLAAAKFEAAIARNPRVASSFNGLGVAYAAQKQWDKAINSWDRALKENADNYDAMLNLAFAYLENKDKARAVALFRSFEKNAPADRYASDLARVRNILRELQ